MRTENLFTAQLTSHGCHATIVCWLKQAYKKVTLLSMSSDPSYKQKSAAKPNNLLWHCSVKKQKQQPQCWVNIYDSVGFRSTTVQMCKQSGGSAHAAHRQLPWTMAASCPTVFDKVPNVVQSHVISGTVVNGGSRKWLCFRKQNSSCSYCSACKAEIFLSWCNEVHLHVLP